MKGILLVDKPADWTSFDVVNYVRKIVATSQGKKPKNVKVGHTGTLDPFATGLLVLLIGKEYTIMAKQLAKVDKTYEIFMHMGASSSTGDPEGEIEIFDQKKPNQQQIEDTLKEFKGESMQKPPSFSAVKVNGQRAYKLARSGQTVDLEPRKIKINRLELTSYNYPEVRLIADVSSGTYIRTLVEDIARRLKTRAYTKELRRTKVGDYSINQAIQLEGLNAQIINENLIKKIIE